MTEVESTDWRAIGTGVRLVVHDSDLASARAAVETVLDAVDRIYSRFRDDSEIVGLNAQAGRRVSISPLLADAIAAGLRAARLTDGAVDPTVGRAMRAIGYDTDFSLVPSDGGPCHQDTSSARSSSLQGQWRSPSSSPARWHTPSTR